MSGTTTFWATGSIGGQTSSAVVYSEGLQGGTGGTSGDLEAIRQYTFSDAGTLSGLYANVSTNTCASNAVTVVRINTANGNQTLTIGSGSGTGEFTDSTHTDAVVSTTLFADKTTGPTTGSWTGLIIANQFTPSTPGNTLTVISSDGPNTGYVSGTTYYNPLCGQNGNPGTATETQAQYQSQANRILRYLFVNCDTYTGSAAATVRVRVGAANGNQSVSPNALGNFIDSTHLDLLSVGSLYDYSSTFTSGTYGTGFVAVDLLSTNGQALFATGTPSGTGITFAANTTSYLALCTRLRSSTTESQASFKTGTSFTASLLQMYVEANGVTANSVLTSRVNAGAGNQTLTFASGVSGAWHQDTTHTDAVGPATELDIEFATGATGTTIIPTSAGLLTTYPNAAAANPLFFGCLV